MDLDGKELVKVLSISAEDLASELTHVIAPFGLRRRSVEAKIIADSIAPQPDPGLRAMLIRAPGWARELKSGIQLSEIDRHENDPGSFI